MFRLGRRGIKLILFGAFLLILSFLLSLLMTIRVIQPNFLLIFVTYSLSVAGLVIGYVLFLIGPTEAEYTKEPD